MKEGAYLALAGRIRLEVGEIARVAERATRIWATAISTSTDYYLDATALNLHSFYAGIEHLLEAIADEVDRTKPAGPTWHQDLLRQMTAEIPTIRPPVIRAETRDRLNRYRGFRHVVRNVYTFNLDADQIGLLMRDLDATWQLVSQDLLAFADTLERMAAEE